MAGNSTTNRYETQFVRTKLLYVYIHTWPEIEIRLSGRPLLSDGIHLLLVISMQERYKLSGNEAIDQVILAAFHPNIRLSNRFSEDRLAGFKC